jgi:PKHD-type hydroxylase
MHLQILTVLSPAEVERAVAELRAGEFVDGKRSAGGRAAEVKHNLQLEPKGAEPSPVDETIVTALARHQEFQAFAYPKRILPPLYSKYEPGMHYGAHVDLAIMRKPVPTRTDLAITVFLAPPDSYDGGELIIEDGLGEQEIKLAAGEAVVYPATTMHRVAPVTRGVRLAAVTWVQCAVQDERMRAALYDLARAIRSAEAAGDGATSTLLHKCYNNLLRLCVDL